IPSRRVGQRALPASSASSVSRSCTEAGTTATASQCPSASTSATRLRPTTPLAASYPRGPRTATHFTACVSTMASVGPGRLPPLPRPRGAEARGRPRPPPPLAPPAARHVPQQGVEQAQLEPAPEPAVHGPPRRPAGRQGAPGAAHPQVPGDRAPPPPDRRRASAPRRVGPLQPSRDLLDRANRHQLLQARL